METVKLSNKGQIVIPKAIRDDLHLPPGTEFIISVNPAGLTLIPKALFPKATTSQVRGFLAKRGRTMPEEADIKNRIKARLKAQDDLNK